MKLLYYTAALLWLPFAALAQTMPLRFNAPGGSNEAVTINQCNKTFSVCSGSSALAKQRCDRKMRNCTLRNYWLVQEQVQQRLAQALSKQINDSIDDVRTRLNAQPGNPIDYRKAQMKLDEKRDGIPRRIAPFTERQAYCRYHRLNVKRLKFMPVSSRQDAPLFFNTLNSRPGAEFLAKSLTVINPNTGKLSLYNELYGDYVGWWRVAFGTTLVGSNGSQAESPAEAKNEASLQRLVGGGGNILLSATLPLAYFHTDDDAVGVKLVTLNKIATDLPQAGSTSSDFAYHSDLGLELSAYYRGFNKTITPFTTVRVGRVWGNAMFYDNLGRTDMSGMLVGQVMAGIGITDVLQVSGTYHYGSAFIRDNFPFSLSLTLQPKLLPAE
ncbi:hypothetical protein Q5H92_16565 [Hymenobacter sp. M29]|uniref:Uncharacterized protein n=1 Tax=Hymenobacter mellowenesis TaxID=3063995 RepID=A0ABT9ADQ1_9BACT|nr:hypothetical protein [Hymenobacter sp. M29]MDO7847980.1 hypothetical protein [Hymenobacter sp. M29]